MRNIADYVLVAVVLLGGLVALGIGTAAAIDIERRRARPSVVNGVGTFVAISIMLLVTLTIVLTYTPQG
jgi:hypothetical protein